MSEYLFGLWTCKNLSVLVKFGYVFAVKNLNLLNTKSWMFVFIYALLSTDLCDNSNVITKTGSIMGFLQWPAISIFGLEILKTFFFPWILLQVILLFDGNFWMNDPIIYIYRKSRYLRIIATMPTFMISHKNGKPDFALV